MLALPLKFQPVGAIQTSKPRRRDSVDRRISSKPPPFERSSTLASGKCKLRAFWARTRMCRKFGRVEMEPSYQALHVVYSLKQKTIPATSSSSSTSSVEEFSIFLSCHRLHGQGCTRRRPPTFTRTILKVGIVEKGIGKSKSIQITNSKGCLSEPEITHMVKVTEDFAAEDETIVLDVFLFGRILGKKSSPKSSSSAAVENVKNSLVEAIAKDGAEKRTRNREERDLHSVAGCTLLIQRDLPEYGPVRVVIFSS